MPLVYGMIVFMKSLPPLSCTTTSTGAFTLTVIVNFLLYVSSRVIQFLGPAPVSRFPPPETGEGEGGGEGRWRAQTVLLPPIPTFPRQGGRGRRPREVRGKSRTKWSWRLISFSLGISCELVLFRGHNQLQQATHTHGTRLAF